VPEVAIIGAGSAGLAAAEYLLTESDGENGARRTPPPRSSPPICDTFEGHAPKSDTSSDREPLQRTVESAFSGDAMATRVQGTPIAVANPGA